MDAFKEVEIEKVSDAFDLIGEEWFLISAGGIDDWNTMTASWGGFGVLWHRKVVFIFVRPSRHTHSFLEREERFSISFFDMPEFRKALEFCGSRSGRDVNKAKGAGLTPFEIEPGIVSFREARTVLVCKRIHSQPLDPDRFVDPSIEEEYPDRSYHTIFVGEIQRSFGRDD